MLVVLGLKLQKLVTSSFDLACPGCHNLDADGKTWLAANRHRVELFRLPPYSPEFNPIEGVWKETKKRTTHNRFFRTTEERDGALIATFAEFDAQPSLIAGQVARFL